MRIQTIAGAAALAVCIATADAAPTAMVQARQHSVETADGDSGRMGWLTKWWRKPTPAPVAVAGMAPPTYQSPVQQHAAGYPVAGSPAVGPTMAPTTAPGSYATTALPTLPLRTTPLPSAPSMPTPSAQALSAKAPSGQASSVSVDDTIAQAQAAEGRGQVDTARQMLAQCAAANPMNSQVRRRRGHLEDRAGRLAEAETHYRQAIACDPTSAAAVNDLGLCLARQGRFDQSIATFQQAITMRPEKPLYRNNIATVFVQLGRFDKALESLGGAYGPAVARYNLGQLMLRADRTVEAAEQFRQALAIDATMLPAQSALEQLGVPKTPTLAITPAETPAYEEPTNVWPSEPVADPRLAAAPTPEGEFPRLLPPVIER